MGALSYFSSKHYGFSNDANCRTPHSWALHETFVKWRKASDPSFMGASWNRLIETNYVLNLRWNNSFDQWCLKETWEIPSNICKTWIFVFFCNLMSPWETRIGVYINCRKKMKFFRQSKHGEHKWHMNQISHESTISRAVKNVIFGEIW